MSTEIKCIFHDRLNNPINNLEFFCEFSGEAAITKEKLKLGTSDRNGIIQIPIGPGRIRESGELYITFYIITDTNRARNTIQYKQIGEKQPVILNKNNIYKITSSWLRINLPLTPDRSKEDLIFTVDEGLYQITYIKRTIINNQKQDSEANVTVYLNDIPKRILDTALKYRNSTIWAKGVSKTSVHPTLQGNNTYLVPAGACKCSQFVNDILILTAPEFAPPWLERGAGQYIPGYASKYDPPLASDWADKTKLTARWDYFSTPKPGDIGSYKANYSNATGHNGFVITEGVTISAGEHKILVNDAGFRDSDKHVFDAFRRHKNVQR